MNRYQHTQVGYVVIWVLCLAAAMVAIKVPSESAAARELSLAIATLLLLSLPVFYKLTVKIDDKILRISFGLGLVRKDVSLAAIDSCEPIRIRWWYGWGIHLTPYGWLYNVSGWDAVAIKLRDGRKFAIGTDDPYALAEAIRRFASAR